MSNFIISNTVDFIQSIENLKNTQQRVLSSEIYNYILTSNLFESDDKEQDILAFVFEQNVSDNIPFINELIIAIMCKSYENNGKKYINIKHSELRPYFLKSNKHFMKLLNTEEPSGLLERYFKHCLNNISEEGFMNFLDNIKNYEILNLNTFQGEGLFCELLDVSSSKGFLNGLKKMLYNDDETTKHVYFNYLDDLTPEPNAALIIQEYRQKRMELYKNKLIPYKDLYNPDFVEDGQSLDSYGNSDDEE